MMKFIKHLLMAFAFTLAAIYFTIICVALLTHGWEGGLWDSGGFLPCINLFAALCAALIGLAILFTIAYIVSKVCDFKKYD